MSELEILECIEDVAADIDVVRGKLMSMKMEDVKSKDSQVFRNMLQSCTAGLY